MCTIGGLPKPYVISIEITCAKTAKNREPKTFELSVIKPICLRTK